MQKRVGSKEMHQEMQEDKENLSENEGGSET